MFMPGGMLSVCVEGTRYIVMTAELELWIFYICQRRIEILLCDIWSFKVVLFMVTYFTVWKYFFTSIFVNYLLQFQINYIIKFFCLFV